MRITGALIAAALGFANVAAADLEKEQVFQIEVLIEGNEVSVLSLQPAKYWTKESLPGEPRLTGETWRNLEHDQSELLAVVYDPKGKVLRTYAYPGRYVAFLETSASASPELHWQGGFGSPAKNVRMLFLSVPSQAAYILFFRSEVRHDPWSSDLDAGNRKEFDAFATEEIDEPRHGVPGEVATFGWKFLGKCPIPQDPRNKPPKPFGEPELPRIFHFPPLPLPLPDISHRMFPNPEWWKLLDQLWTISPIPCATGPGTVTGHVPLNTAAPSTTHRAYNVVIFGDGFANNVADTNLFQSRADLVVTAMQTISPYSDHFGNINIWRIDTESLTSGIANCTGTDGLTCPNPLVDPNTYYLITGCNESTLDIPGCNPTSPRYLGPTALCPFDVAAEQELPGVYVDLRLVIANCDSYGGAAYPADRLVVVTTCTEYTDTQVFTNLLLHESAHAIGFVCDEYWGCVKWEGEQFPNFATLAQVNADDVPWKGLDPFWTVHKHVLGTAPCTATGADHNWNPFSSPAVDGSVPPSLHGAFWGCGFIDSGAVDSTRCCEWSRAKAFSDPLGAPYFRPSPRCKMRELEQPFCFACSDAIGHWLGHPLFFIMP